MFGLFKRKNKPTQAAPVPTVTVNTSITYDVSGEVLVAGTTTFSRDAVDRLIARHGRDDRGIIEIAATITPEPDNPVDSKVIAVIVEGEKVGALPSAYSHNMEMEKGTAQEVTYQLNYLRSGENKTKAKAFIWLGPTPPMWTYNIHHPAPLLTSEQAAENHARHVEIAARNLGPDTPIGRALRSGNMGGFTPLELIEPIKQLKREKRWDDALKLLYAAIEGEERGYQHRGGIPAPWFTEHAAICHRKLKQHDEEVAVLKRYLDHLPPEYREDNKIRERLDKIEGKE